ncbi:outer membrane efflux protein [mine drainage metagenome]|uniref:Outer membrane efflux protein n=1 Tax=mine drainage metagenome TaxID=410659 RepID=A0A1J5S8L2_9ZZZZ
MRITSNITFVILLLIPIFATGEEAWTLVRNQQLTLPMVVSKALERSPKQQVLQAGNTLVDAKKIHANSILPAAPAIIIGHQDDAIGSNRNLSQWEAGVELPVWMPGQRNARETVARDAQTELDSTRNGLALEIAGQVREAIWDVNMTMGAVELADSQYNAALALQNDVEKRWKAGELAKTDVMLAQNGTLLAKTALLRIQAELKHAEHRYWVLTGLKEIPQSAEEKLSKRDTIDDNHPWLAEITSKVEMARGQRDLVSVERRENPQVQINARRDRGAFDSLYNDSIGVLVRVPLDAKVRSAPMMADAEMAIAQATSERDQRQLILQTSLHEAEHNLEVIREELKIVEEQHHLAQENLRLAKKSFALGEADLVTLLRGQSMAYEAERSLINRRTQLQWNIARYNQAIGVLP